MHVRMRSRGHMTSTGLWGTCAGVGDQVQDVSGFRVDVEADVHLGPGQVDDEVGVVLH